MSRPKILFAFLFLCSALVMTAAAQKHKDTPVTTTDMGSFYFSFAINVTNP